MDFKFTLHMVFDVSIISFTNALAWGGAQVAKSLRAPTVFVTPLGDSNLRRLRNEGIYWCIAESSTLQFVPSLSRQTRSGCVLEQGSQKYRLPENQRILSPNSTLYNYSIIL